MTVERQLFVDADLTIDIEGEQLTVRGDGSSLIVEVPSASLAFKLMRNIGSTMSLRSRASRLASTLTRLGLTMVIRTPRRKLLTIGRYGNSRILRLFGVRNANLHLS